METIVDKSKEKIEEMFDEIAPSYDKLNHMFTLNFDILWRKQIVRNLMNYDFERENILDLASGTGDLAKELLDLNCRKIFAVDISEKMLEIQSTKIHDKRLTLIQSEAASLPFESSYFQVVTIGFGVRNFDNLQHSFAEIYRVLKPGGKLIILEIFKGHGVLYKIFNLYFGKVIPFFGKKFSGSKYAYDYLFNSVDTFYNVDDFQRISEKNGFKCDSFDNNFLGVVNTLYLSKI